MSESKEVAKYDRAFLEHREHQPMKEVDGFMITLDHLGNFCAEVHGVEIRTDTLAKAEERVHRAYMAQQKKERARIGRGKPCFMYGTKKSEGWGREPLAAHGFFRGVHAGNGDYLFRLPDGSKGQSSDLTLFPLDHPEIGRLQALQAKSDALDEERESVRKEIESIVKPQQDKMLKGIRRSYGTNVYVRNDAEKAFELTISVLENVFGEKIEVEADEQEPA